MAKLVGNAFINLLEARCETCNYWASSADSVNARPGFHPCDLASGIDAGPVHSPTKAFAMDKESYMADLFTAPDFGCIQWKAKDEKQGGIVAKSTFPIVGEPGPEIHYGLKGADAKAFIKAVLSIGKEEVG